MKRLVVATLLLAPVFGNFAIAQSDTLPLPSEREPSVNAVITGPSDIGVGRTLVLDGSASQTGGERTEYRWSIDETKSTIGREAQAIFTPERTGTLTFRLTVRSIALDGTVETAETTQVVTVFRKKIAIIADQSVRSDRLTILAENAMKDGVFVRVVQSGRVTSSLTSEDALTRAITEQQGATAGAEAIVLWTEGIAGLQALMRSVTLNPDTLPAIKNQSLILLTRQNLGTIGRTTRGALSILDPRELIITREKAIEPLLASSNLVAFKETLVTDDIEERSFTSESFVTRPWNLLSILINYLLSNGVAAQTIILLLVLPVIATFFTFLKQVIGVTTFGLYTPSVITLSFLVLGWWTALLFLIFILTMGSLTRVMMQKWRLLYIPKVAITLTVVSFTLLLLLGIGTAAGIQFSRDTVFILLILSTLSENFYSLKSEEGWSAAVLGIGQTLLGAIICVFLIEWFGMGALLLAYPELLLFTIVINIVLGRYTGLRLVEYFRFRELFLHLQEEE